jgi:ATP-dependent DNA ligase
MLGATEEIKLDGYRIEVVRTGGETTIYSRRQNVLNHKFPYIAKALDYLPADTVLDGELVAMGPDGKPNFNLLQNFKSAESPHHLLRLRCVDAQRSRPNPGTTF